MRILQSCVVLLAATVGCADLEATEEVEVSVISQADTAPNNWNGAQWGCESMSLTPDDVITVNGVMGREYRSNAPDDPNAGHNGCDGAYVVDYNIPRSHPNWNMAFMHSAHYEEWCSPDWPLWHNQRVYYIMEPLEHGGPPLVRLANHRSWIWAEECNTQSVNDVPEIKIESDQIRKVRIATQFGFGDRYGQFNFRHGLSQMVYMQTSD